MNTPTRPVLVPRFAKRLPRRTRMQEIAHRVALAWRALRFGA